MTKHLIRYTQDTIMFEPLRETCEDKFLLVDFQTKENYNNHKKQSFRALYYMINKLCSQSDEASGIYYISFYHGEVPDNCPEIIAPLMEKPSCVRMCYFRDDKKNQVKIGIEFYSKYNEHCYHNQDNNDGLECLEIYADIYLKNGPYKFGYLESGGTKNDIVFDVPISTRSFAIKNPPEW